jgi:hypothetical protein
MIVGTVYTDTPAAGFFTVAVPGNASSMWIENSLLVGRWARTSMNLTALVGLVGRRTTPSLCSGHYVDRLLEMFMCWSPVLSNRFIY